MATEAPTTPLDANDLRDMARKGIKADPDNWWRLTPDILARVEHPEILIYTFYDWGIYTSTVSEDDDTEDPTTLDITDEPSDRDKNRFVPPRYEEQDDSPYTPWVPQGYPMWAIGRTAKNYVVAAIIGWRTDQFYDDYEVYPITSRGACRSGHYFTDRDKAIEHCDKLKGTLEAEREQRAKRLTNAWRAAHGEPIETAN